MAAMAQYDEEFTQCLNGGKDAGIHPKVDRDGGQKAGRDKIENEKGEDGLETDPFPLAFLPLPGIEKGQHQGDGDDGQGAGELHSDRFVQGGGSQSPHAVPGGRSCGDEEVSLTAVPAKMPKASPEVVLKPMRLPRTEERLPKR